MIDSHSFQGAKKIIEKLNSHGYEAFIVGGAVRDMILNREIHDTDITTSAPTEVIKTLFSRTIDIAMKHGTVIVRIDHTSYEVTAYRGQSLISDLGCRDFTINAMAFHQDSKIFDPFSGVTDLKAKLIRGVLDPASRFEEDPLRMVRAIRFVSELDFYIEGDTLKAITEASKRIKTTAIERVVNEFEKICLGQNAPRALQYFKETRLLEYIDQLTEVSNVLTDPKNWNGLLSLKTVTEVWSFILYQSKTLHINSFLRSLKQSRKLINDVEKVVATVPHIIKKPMTESDLYHVGLERAIMAERVKSALLNEPAEIKTVKDSFNKLPIHEKRQIALKGQVVGSLLRGNAPKSRFGEIMKIVEEAILTRKVENSEGEIILWLRKEGHIDA